MNGIIILEGGDGTGKTTLARHLVQHHGAYYIHNGLWPNIWQRHLAAVRLATRLAQRRLVVIDRLWISEQIYGQVFRKGPAYDLGARALDRALMRFGALTVLCVRRDVERHLAHFEALRASRPEKFDSVEKVAWRYLDLADGRETFYRYRGNYYVNQITNGADENVKYRLDFDTYDMDREGDDLRGVCNGLVKRLAHVRSEALPGQFDPAFPNLSGNHNTARYLFVGEGLSPRACRRALPFLWNDEPSAASHLNATLRALNFDETLGLWTNAEAPDDWLPLLAKRLSVTTRIIALGNVAAKRVDRVFGAGFDRVKLHHPQYDRRFRAGQPDYKRELRAALNR